MSVSRKVQMGAGGSGGVPWTFDQAKFNGVGGTNGQYNYGEYSASGVVLKDDGSQMFVITYNSLGNSQFASYIESYSLGTPYEVGSATRTYQQQVFTTGAAAFGNLRVNDDGTLFYFTRNSQPYQLELSTGWDLSSYVSTTVGDALLSSGGLFNGSGTVYYEFPSNGLSINVFNLSTAWDITTGVTAGTDITSISGQGFSSVENTGFCHDGSVLYIQDSDSGNVFTAVDVTTPFDLTTINWSSKTTNDTYGTNINPEPGNVVLSLAYTQLMGRNTFTVASDANTTRIVSCYTGLTTAISNSGPSAADLVNFNIDVPSNVYNPPPGDAGNGTGSDPWYGVKYTNISNQFNADGSKLLIGRHFNNTSTEIFYLYEESLSTNYDISSSSYTLTRELMTGDPSLNDNTRSYSFRFTEDGTQSILMLVDYVTGSTYQYDKSYVMTYSTPFSPSSLTTTTEFNREDFRLSPFIFGASAMFNDTKDEITFAVSNSLMRTTSTDFAYNLRPGLYTVPLGTPGDITTADTSGLGRCQSVSYASFNERERNAGLEFDSTGSTYVSIMNDVSRGRGYIFNAAANYGASAYSATEIVGLLPASKTNTPTSSSPVGLKSIAFNDDGTKFYTLDDDNSSIITFNLSTPYDISEVSASTGLPDNYWYSFVSSAGSSDVDSLTMNPTGTKLYRLETSAGKVHEYTLTTAFDLSTSTGQPVAELSVSTDVSGGDISWGDNGNYFYRINRDGAPTIDRYAASTPYDIGSCGATPDKTKTFGSLGTQADKMFFKPDGTSVFMYMLNFASNQEQIFQFDMSVAWDVSSISATTVPDQSVTLPLVNDDWAAGIYFKSDGSQLFVAQQTSWYKFNLGTNWDITSVVTPVLSENQYSTFTLPSKYNGINGLFVSPDETKVFIGTITDFIIRTDFGTALDFRTIFHDGGANYFCYSDPQNVSGVARNIGTRNHEFRWKPDGTSFYIMSSGSTNTVQPIPYNNTNNNAVFSQFNLTTAFDLTTATYSGFKDITNSVSAPSLYSFDISSNGEHLILADDAGLYMGTMTTPWDITTLGTVTSQLVGGLRWDQKQFTSTETCAVRWHPNNGSAIYTRSGFGGGDMATQKMTLTTPYDPTTAVGAVEGTAKFQEALPTTSIWGSWPGTSLNYPHYTQLQFHDDGNYLYFLETTTADNEKSADLGKNIRAFSLSTPYDVTTATEMTNFNIPISSPPSENDFTKGQNVTTVGYFDWHPDGKKFIVSSGFLIGEFKA